MSLAKKNRKCNAISKQKKGENNCFSIKLTTGISSILFPFDPGFQDDAANMLGLFLQFHVVDLPTELKKNSYHAQHYKTKQNVYFLFVMQLEIQKSVFKFSAIFSYL